MMVVCVEWGACTLTGNERELKTFGIRPESKISGAVRVEFRRFEKRVGSSVTHCETIRNIG